MPGTIRLATPDDAEQLLGIYGPYCATPISFEAVPPSMAEMRQRISTVLQGFPWLVCEQGGEILGYVYASPHRERAAYRWSVDTSAYIQPHRQRLGLGRALYTSLFQLLPLQGFINAYAGTTIPNPASVGLHEAMGFALVGVYRQVGYKCGAWHDVAWYQKLLQPRPSPPESPKPLAEVQNTAAWLAAMRSGQLLLRIPQDGGPCP